MSIIAKYSLNGNANDSSGSNNGTATNVTYVQGKQNQGGSFNGTSSKIDVTNTGFGITGNYTLSALIKCTTLNLQANIISKDPLTSGNRDFQFRANSDGTLSFFRADSAMGALSDITTTGFTINDGKRHLVVARFSTTGGSQIFIDGVIRATNATLTAKAFVSSTLQIGARGDSQYFFTGNIDEVEINNIALSDTEIKNKYLYYNGFM